MTASNPEYYIEKNPTTDLNYVTAIVSGLEAWVSNAASGGVACRKII